MGRCATRGAPRPIPLHHSPTTDPITLGLYLSVDERRGSGHGRRIVQDELQQGGSALPWRNPIDFARRALATAITDYDRQAASARQGGWVFFDRGIVDAAA